MKTSDILSLSYELTQLANWYHEEIDGTVSEFGDAMRDWARTNSGCRVVDAAFVDAQLAKCNQRQALANTALKARLAHICNRIPL